MTALPENIYEAEFASGLLAIAKDELRTILQSPDDMLDEGNEYIRFSTAQTISVMSTLRSVSSVYALLEFSIPRPKALLGHQHFTRIVDTIHAIIGDAPDRYQTFNLSAAGSDSSVMQRLKAEIATATGLGNDETGGDLFVRVRRRKPYWDVLVRISPRPLSTRNWRTCDYEGALNAPMAYALATMTTPVVSQKLLNLCCGSASLMIERLAIAPAERVTGVDHSEYALSCARKNLLNAGYHDATELIHADVRALPLSAETYDVLLSDLPFGQRTGSHEDNVRLYPLLLHEAARVARSNATFVLLTHEIRLIQTILQQQSHWNVISEQRVDLRGLHPRFYILRRS